MPSIEITAAQAQALANGQNITIVPTKRRYIVVFENGNVFDVETTNDVPYAAQWATRTIEGTAKLIAKGPHSSIIGATQSTLYGKCIAIKVPA